MKVLVIQGSPMEKSRTGILANIAMKYAKKGNEVKMIDLSSGKMEMFSGRLNLEKEDQAGTLSAAQCQ